MKERPEKRFPTIGCCGIDCGLCPRHHTAGSSRCPGCAGSDFFEKHPSCGFITCCVKQRKLEVCSECHEFPCSRFDSWTGGDSFVSHRVALLNLSSIRETGLERFREQQEKRMSLLQTMLEEFDDGRSKSFYCTAAALLAVAALEESLRQALERIGQAKVKPADVKTRAGMLRGLLNDRAAGAGVELKLRRR